MAYLNALLSPTPSYLIFIRTSASLECLSASKTLFEHAGQAAQDIFTSLDKLSLFVHNKDNFSLAVE